MGEKNIRERETISVILTLSSMSEKKAYTISIAMIREQKRQQRTQKHSSSSSTGMKRRARRRQRTRKRHGPTPRLSQTSSHTTKTQRITRDQSSLLERQHTIFHPQIKQLSSKNARLSQTQTFSPYNESPKRKYRESSKRLFRRRRTMFHPEIHLLSSTNALPPFSQ